MTEIGKRGGGWNLSSTQLFMTAKTEIDCFSPVYFSWSCTLIIYTKDIGALIWVAVSEELQLSSLQETHQNNICLSSNEKALSSNLFRFILV